MAGHPKIVIFQDESGGPPQWRWHIEAGNGEVVAQGEGHTREADAVRAATTAADLLNEAIDTASIERLEPNEGPTS